MEPATITSSVAAVMGVALAVDRYIARRALNNGGKPVTEKAARETESRLKAAIDHHARAVAKHIESNHDEHGDLHSRITDIATDVATIKGRLSAET